VRISTFFFYALVVVVAVAPVLLVWHFWHEARVRGWAWTSVDSRNMYVDGAKTIITASGIAVALLASSGVAVERTASHVIGSAAKVAAVCLIACICLSLVLILALLRGHERAKSRFIEERRKAGDKSVITEGKLNTTELLFILIPASLALSCFLVGFVFLGRIAYHF
jgi:hypothetical protein